MTLHSALSLPLSQYSGTLPALSSDVSNTIATKLRMCWYWGKHDKLPQTCVGFYNAHPSEAARAMVMLADALGSDLLQHVLEVPTALIAASDDEDEQANKT
ncbi:hypothetical protein ACOMHN_023343 [Nucella lapillus]